MDLVGHSGHSKRVTTRRRCTGVIKCQGNEGRGAAESVNKPD